MSQKSILLHLLFDLKKKKKTVYIVHLILHIYTEPPPVSYKPEKCTAAVKLMEKEAFIMVILYRLFLFLARHTKICGNAEK